MRCPACGKQALYSADNPARPFCSPRCRNVDLGAWASESYRVAADTPAEADDDAVPPDAALTPPHWRIAACSAAGSAATACRHMRPLKSASLAPIILLLALDSVEC